MRGKGLTVGFRCWTIRITPAYAGKRRFQHPFSSLRRDHPRLCGEKSQIPLKNSPIPGSPPPMRGKAYISRILSGGNGITPAYAGKSSKQSGNLSKPWDHPRLCGEKLRRNLVKQLNLGSPPPMRGKVNIPEYNETLDRITPAYAGKSVSVLHSDLIQ